MTSNHEDFVKKDSSNNNSSNGGGRSKQGAQMRKRHIGASEIRKRKCENDLNKTRRYVNFQIIMYVQYRFWGNVIKSIVQLAGAI